MICLEANKNTGYIEKALSIALGTGDRTKELNAGTVGSTGCLSLVGGSAVSYLVN